MNLLTVVEMITFARNEGAVGLCIKANPAFSLNLPSQSAHGPALHVLAYGVALHVLAYGTALHVLAYGVAGDNAAMSAA